MKSIVCVNTVIPTVEYNLRYNSEGSLRDYDIIVFNPKLPYYGRIEFSGGGSCISIEGTASFTKAVSHWSRELKDALAAGKNVFIVLSEYEEDQAATGSSMTSKTNRTYSTSIINNYSAIPVKINVRNARGRNVQVKDSAFRDLYTIIKEITEYRVVFGPSVSMRKVFTAKDGTAIGGVAKIESWPGSIIFLPHFDFAVDRLTEQSDEGKNVWTNEALQTSHAFVGQLVAIDKMLNTAAQPTPAPNWMAEMSRPNAIDAFDDIIANIDENVAQLQRQRDEQVSAKTDLLEYSHLLYETGKTLELAIEKALRLLGYVVETVRIGDFEIDHVIVSPTGKRMIGESEGKDASAIDITKFRQLESNIGEDFEREEINEPAKGILFGNGFRLTAPDMRPEQFTQKSLTNANRLGSALVRTADLYPVVVHLLNHPEDEAFKFACRSAIENTAGTIVNFPDP